MNKKLYYLLMILLFTTLSVTMYSIQTLLFHDPKNTVFYLFQDLAFVPVQALIATLLLNRFVDLIQRMQTRKKLHVIVSAFFSELGTAIVCMFAELNDNNQEFTDQVDILKASEAADTRKARNELKSKINEFPFQISATPERLAAMSQLLVEKKSFMMGCWKIPVSWNTIRSQTCCGPFSMWQTNCRRATWTIWARQILRT